MSRSKSFGNQVHFFDLVVTATRNNAKELPREATATATQLATALVKARRVGAQQEKMKQDLALATQAVTESVGECGVLAARLVRLAEASFGPRHPRIREFRPVTEARATRRRAAPAKKPEGESAPTDSPTPPQ